MVDFISLLSKVGTLALLLLTGFIGGKAKILNETATERMATFTVKIVQPFLIINSFLGLEFTTDNLVTGLLILALGLCLHAFMAALAFLLAKPVKPLDERKLSEYSMFFANVAFIGFPILETVIGKEGLFYGAFYLVSFHLFVWTWGISILARKREDIKITPKNIILNYGTVPCLIGFILFVSGLKLPEVITSFSGYVAAIGTPLSIMITGANIARRSLKKMFTNGNVYYVCAVKLIVMPLVAALLMRLIGLPQYMIIFGGIMAAMPCPAISTMFGEMYRISPGYAAELVGTSTLLSTATIIPVVTLVGMIAAI